ncbi:MAG: YjbQ family protein [Chromatiales bacterium]|jgi:secondary thiamine-phosphate synthase enzyme|nr:YjbQ family protein [Chromatiales bacterium]
MLYGDSIDVRTAGRGMVELTSEIQARVGAMKVESGLCHLFVHHTSASLLLCENADRDVLRDMEAFFSRLVMDGNPSYIHRAEGPDDMAAHIRSVLTHTDVQIPIREGRCDLGTWQGIFLWEHRTAPHHRRISVTVQALSG